MMSVNSDHRAGSRSPFICYNSISSTQKAQTMSATKELLHDIQTAQDVVDEVAYRVDYDMTCLSNLAWSAGNEQPVWAPDKMWIKVTRHQLMEAMNALSELEAAADILDHH